MNKQIENAKINDVQVSRSRCGYDPSPPQSCVQVDAKNLGDCSNISIRPRGRRDGVIANIPVTLAELSVRFFVNAIIDLPEPALEIRDIKKNLKITQCKLLQPSNVLFIKGFIRKNIDYSTATCSNLEGVCGEIHHCTIDVPFESTTTICFTKQPDDLCYNRIGEFGHPGNNSLSLDFCNQSPFCDLLYSQITEFDEFTNHVRPDNLDLPFKESFFTQFEEKMVIDLGIRVLQNQQVNIPRTSCYNPRIQDELDDIESEDKEPQA